MTTDQPFHTLTRHAQSEGAAAARVSARTDRRSGGVVHLSFMISGALDDLILPPLAAQRRQDELWRTTCLECFIRRPDGRSYLEINLSPSGAWAAYEFEDYRAGGRNADGAALLSFDRREDDNALQLDAALRLPSAPAGAAEIGLTAILEDRAGAKSYWALAHAAGAPDFHHPDTFAATL